MFNTEKESLFNEMDKYGIQISAMGDIMIDEIMMMRLQEMVGLDIKIDGSVDVDGVLLNAKAHGFRNLGGFGGRSCSQEDNYVFHMDSDEVEEMIGASKLVDKAVEIGTSYLDLGYYLENRVYDVVVEVSMVDTVRIKAESKDEAINKILNDVADYTELGKLVSSEHYNGIVTTMATHVEDESLK